MKNDSLGDRMKEYESRESSRRFIPMIPIYARIDGRGFSNFTRGMGRPFDEIMSELMIKTTEDLIEETHARIGYTQSDEISLVWLSERSDSSIFFDNKITKMTSVLASFATATFIKNLLTTNYTNYVNKLPHFDARVFQLPNKTEAANVFLWREQDATKNAVSMAARTVCSHKSLHKKNSAEMQEMLFAKGINFNDYPSRFKRGTFVRRETVLRPFTAEELERIPIKHRPNENKMVQRSKMTRLDMPRFGSVANREAVIFDAAQPEISLEIV